MFFNSTKITLVNTMMIGVIMVICSNNWISMWMGLEISLMSFIPLMNSENNMSSQSMMVYFMVQSVASALFLLSVVFMLIGVNVFNEMVLMTAMLLKMGSAPFHNWVLVIIEPMEYFIMMILLTIMKIPPLIIMFYSNMETMSVPIMLNFLISSVSCINQPSIKKMLVYSSMFNIGILMSSINKLYMMIDYIMIYSVNLIMLMFILMKMKIKFINQMMFNEFSIWLKINILINMLSLSGFPPLSGFIMKIMIMQNLLENKQMIMLAVMLLTSMIVTMFYMRITFSSVMMSSTFKKWTMNYSKSNTFIMWMNFLMVPFLILMINIK
uniref:NADH dehydrogenase subunit 2 n=1 Tax=Eupelix cuspidata TaxID=139504 RepID=UPI002E79385E|nr:NADH dehydrogenase subunit 2 [Eupelix cuspidata]WRK21440.1 NADH dehydrogenase subunit 2 [Eupelix cuspidata]